LASTFGTLLSSQGTDAHPADHHTPRRPTRGQLSHVRPSGQSGQIPSNGSRPGLFGPPADEPGRLSPTATDPDLFRGSSGARDSLRVRPKPYLTAVSPGSGPPRRTVPGALTVTTAAPSLSLTVAPPGPATSRCPLLPTGRRGVTLGTRRGRVKSGCEAALPCSDSAGCEEGHLQRPVTERPHRRRARPRRATVVRAEAAASGRPADHGAPPSRPHPRSCGC
jgi:hypothetical protein